MTDNIHVGVGMDKKLDRPRIAGVINAQHPDLAGEECCIALPQRHILVLKE